MSRMNGMGVTVPGSLGPESDLLEVEDEVVDQDGNGTSPTGVPNPADATLEMHREALQANQQLARILGDPEIQKVLAARQAGKKLTIATEDELGQQTGEEKPVDLNTLDFDAMDSKQVAQTMMKAIASMIPQMIKQQLQPVTEQIGQVRSTIQKAEVSKLTSQIQDLRSKYRDFDTFIPVMQKIGDENPGLQPEEIYLLAKRRSGKHVFAQPQKPGEAPSTTNTERPTSTTARPPKRVPFGAMAGRNMFRQALDSAMKTVDFSDVMQAASEAGYDTGM